VKGIKEIVVAVTSTGIVTALLAVYFNWRTRLLRRIRADARDGGFKSILVAVDLREGSTAAVAKALSMAAENTRVTVMHVVPDVTLAGASRYMYRLRQPEYQRQLAREAWRRMAEIIPANTTAPKVHARVVIGDPTTQISRVAREADADLILVGMTPTRNDGKVGIAA